MRHENFLAVIIFLASVMTSGCGSEASKAPQELLNVSCAPTREFYAAYNEKFKDYWENELHNGKVIINQSHGASGKQALAVIDGLEADVVALSIPYDVTKIKEAGLIRGGWRKEFPDNSSPYTSTIVFIVRKDNPKNIQDWDDLIRADVKIVTPNPKTSGGARWNYLAAWEYARRNLGDDEALIMNFMKKIFKNIVALDEEVRSARKSFLDGKGDVLIAWENESLNLVKESPEKYEIVTPNLSIVAEMSVAVVDSVVDKRGTREVAEEYLKWHYSPEAQEIAAQNFYRPRDAKILAKYADTFEELELFTVDEAFGSWVKAHDDHFADGATFDQIYRK